MSSPRIVVRCAVTEDAASVAALLTELGHPTEPEFVPERLDRLREEGGAALLAVEAAGTPLGFVSLAVHAVVHAPGPVALITALVVKKAARGHGVGRSLVASATSWAMERGCVRLLVTSGEARADAHAFYAACGLTYTGRRYTLSLQDAR